MIVPVGFVPLARIAVSLIGDPTVVLAEALVVSVGLGVGVGLVLGSV